MTDWEKHAALLEAVEKNDFEKVRNRFSQMTPAEKLEMLQFKGERNMTLFHSCVAWMRLDFAVFMMGQGIGLHLFQAF